MTSHDGYTLDMVDEAGREFTDVMFTVTTQLQQLHLNDNETFLLEAYVIFDGNIIFIIYYLIHYYISSGPHKQPASSAAAPASRAVSLSHHIRGS